MNKPNPHQHLPTLINSLVEHIHAEPRMKHLDRVVLPNRDAIIRSINLLREIVFPGYFGRQDLTTRNLPEHLNQLLPQLTEILYDQVRCCLRYQEGISTENGGNSSSPTSQPSPACAHCDTQAAQTVSTFLARIPEIRKILATDVQAAFDGDPAAQSTDETILCYPGLFAIFVQRFAHQFHNLGVPLLPRIMTEYAHSRTGIDIHPGAQLGQRFFIDHGTGVVIGETTQIGKNVKLYQGVTLGALAPAFGQALRGQKRHPTIEDDVTIYSGATILGGETKIGQAAVIGGNVFLTSSVPPHTHVIAEPPKLKFKDRRPRSMRTQEVVLDFQI